MRPRLPHSHFRPVPSHRAWSRWTTCGQPALQMPWRWVPRPQMLHGLLAATRRQARGREARGREVPSQAVLGRSPDSLPADIRGAVTIDPSKATVPVVYRLIDGKAVVTPVMPPPMTAIVFIGIELSKRRGNEAPSTQAACLERPLCVWT